MSRVTLKKSLDEAGARGIRLKSARLLMDLSQDEAAKRLGVSRQTVSGWENGAEIEEDRMAAVSRVYGARRGWLRYGEGDPPHGIVATGEEVAIIGRSKSRRIGQRDVSKPKRQA